VKDPALLRPRRPARPPGGGAPPKTDHGYWELSFTKESKLKEGETDPIKRKFFIFSAYFLFAIIQFSKQTIPMSKKYWGCICPHPCPPHVTPMSVGTEKTCNIFFLMFNIPVGVCFSSHKKSVTANSVCISLFGDLSYKFRPVMAIIRLL
jgi:hypothetical protein